LAHKFVRRGVVEGRIDPVIGVEAGSFGRIAGRRRPGQPDGNFLTGAAADGVSTEMMASFDELAATVIAI
jgi:hypothetical protein